MKFDGQVLADDTFPCDPTNQEKKCELHFVIDDADAGVTDLLAKTGKHGYVENDCKCSLQKPDSPGYQMGYCSTVLGTEKYRRAMSAFSFMMSEASCHTRDRYNMRAQRDPICGIGSDNDQFRLAIDQVFNVTYWPYKQQEYVFKCVRRVFADSFDQLILDNAIVKLVGLATAMSLFYL